MIQGISRSFVVLGLTFQQTQIWIKFIGKHWMICLLDGADPMMTFSTAHEVQHPL